VQQAAQQQKIVILSCLRDYSKTLPLEQQRVMFERLKLLQAGQVNNEEFLRSLQDRLPHETCEKVMSILKNIIVRANMNASSASQFAVPKMAASAMKRKPDASATPYTAGTTTKKVKHERTPSLWKCRLI
jgi:hypothetical protein